MFIDINLYIVQKIPTPCQDKKKCHYSGSLVLVYFYELNVLILRSDNVLCTDYFFFYPFVTLIIMFMGYE